MSITENRKLKQDIIRRGGARSQNVGWTVDAHGERMPIMGAGGWAPRVVSGRSPLSRVRGKAIPKLKNFQFFGCPTEAVNAPHSSYFANWRVELLTLSDGVTLGTQQELRAYCIILCMCELERTTDVKNVQYGIKNVKKTKKKHDKN